MEKEKEFKVPIYKKWWFWFALVLIIIIVIGISNDDTSKTKSTLSSDNITNTATSTQNETKTEEKRNTVTIPDFSKMSQKEVEKWCDKNNVDYDIEREYSSKVKVGKFIKQSIKANETIYEGEKITIIYSLGKEPTFGEQNALKKAHSYLNSMAFSYTGLIKQLQFEGFSKSEATYGADNCGANWNEQAAKKAQSYINAMSFSKSGLIKQLEFEGFTKSQAQYGAKAVGY